MQTLRIIVIGGLSLTLSCLSAMCCYVFGTHLATGAEGQLYGVLGGVADALKAVLPLGIAAAWGASQRSRALAGAAMFAVFATYSFASELGLYALSRDATAGSALAGKEGYEALKVERARIAGRLKELGSQRPAATVKADQAAARVGKLWEQSAECKEATATASRAFCGTYERLQGELATAEDAERLRGQDEAFAQKMGAMDLSSVLKSADAQSEALSRLTGLAPGSIKDGLAILIAALIELGSGLGLWVASAGAGATGAKGSSTPQSTGGQESQPSAPVRRSSKALSCADGIAPVKRGKPVDPIKLFLKSKCAERRGAEVRAADLHKAFSEWSAAQSLESLSAKALGTRLGELGYMRSKRGGTVRYSGLAVVA